MSVWELLIRSRHPSHLIELSSQYADLPILEWWLWRQEILKVEIASPELLRRFRRDVERKGFPISAVESSDRSHIFFLDHSGHAPDSLWTHAFRHNLLQAPPTVYLGGWGYYRLLGVQEEGIQGFVATLQATSETELLGKKRLPLATLPTTVWSQQLFGNLTGRQSETLLRAADGGYFRSPRGVKAADLARGVGLGRTTFEEHLRKAENQLITNLIPYLRIYRGEVEPEQFVPALLAAWGVERLGGPDGPARPAPNHLTETSLRKKSAKAI
jgi:predicted DNA binding protein